MKSKSRVAKIVFASLLLCFSLFFATINVSAEEIPLMVYYRGEQVLFDTLPEINNGTTFVPLRKTFELFDANVEWDSSTKTITATRGSTTIRLTVGKDTALKDGKSIKLTAKPYIKGVRTMVPLRFIAESFGAQVYYNKDTRTVFINSPHSEGAIKTKRIKRIGWSPYYKLIDLGNTTVRLNDGEEFTIKGIEENGEFIVLTGPTRASDVRSNTSFGIWATLIFEDGYSNRYSFDKIDNYNSIANLGNKFQRIWKLDAYKDFYEHGKLLRIDFIFSSQKITITDLDQNERLYFVNALPVMTEQEMKLPDDRTLSLGAMDFTLNSFVIKDVYHDYYQYAYKIHEFFPDSAVADFTVSPNEDTGMHYDFFVKGGDGGIYGYQNFSDAFIEEFSAGWGDGYYKGIPVDFPIDFYSFPVVDTNKVQLVIRDRYTDEQASYDFKIGPDVPEDLPPVDTLPGDASGGGNVYTGFFDYRTPQKNSDGTPVTLIENESFAMDNFAATPTSDNNGWNVSMRICNKSYASGALEVFDSKGNLVQDIPRVIPGVKAPSSAFDSFVNVFKEISKLAVHDYEYSLLDPKSEVFPLYQWTDVPDVFVPKGGKIVMTKRGEWATAFTFLDLGLQVCEKATDIDGLGKAEKVAMKASVDLYKDEIYSILNSENSDIFDVTDKLLKIVSKSFLNITFEDLSKDAVVTFFEKSISANAAVKAMDYTYDIINISGPIIDYRYSNVKVDHTVNIAAPN